MRTLLKPAFPIIWEIPCLTGKLQGKWAETGSKAPFLQETFREIQGFRPFSLLLQNREFCGQNREPPSLIRDRDLVTVRTS